MATLIPLEESSKEQEVEELRSENNLDAHKEKRGAEVAEKSKAGPMSDEELAESLKEEAKEEQEVEERELEEVEEGKDAELGEGQEKTLNDKLEVEDAEEEAGEDGELTEEDVKDAEVLDKEEIDVEMMPAQTEERRALFEEGDGSSEFEIPADLDYAADSGLLQALQTSAPPEEPDSRLLLETDGKERQTSEDELPTEREAADGGEVSEDDEDKLATSKDARAHQQDHEVNGVAADPEESSELLMSEEEQKSRGHSKSKSKKQKKKHRVRKHFAQSEQPQSGAEPGQPESESSSAENTGSKAKRRRPGKWVTQL